MGRKNKKEKEIKEKKVEKRKGGKEEKRKRGKEEKTKKTFAFSGGIVRVRLEFFHTDPTKFITTIVACHMVTAAL